MAVNFPDYQQSVLPQPAPIAAPASSGIGSAVTSLGSAFEGIHSRYRDEQQKQAVFEARQNAKSTAVYTDDAGVIRTQPLPAPDSPENRAYIETAEPLYTAQVSQAAKQQSALLREQYQNDPEGYRKAFGDWESKQLGGAPSAWLGQTQAVIRQHGTDGYTALQVAAMNRDEVLAQQTWRSQLSDVENKIQGMSEAGLVNDDRATQLHAQREQLLQAGVTRKWIDATGADVYRQNAAVQGTAAGIANIALGEATAKMQGGMTPAEAYTFGRDRIEKYLNDGALSGLSVREREAIRDKFDERWREQNARTTAQTAELDRDFRANVDGIQRGMNVQPTAFLELAQKYRAVGKSDKADEATLWAATAGDVAALSKRPISEIQAGIEAARRGEVTPATVRFMSSAEHVLRLKVAEAQPEVANLQQELASIAKGIELGQPAPLDRLGQIGARMVELGQGEKATDLLRNVDAMKQAASAAKDPIQQTAMLLDSLRQQQPGVNTTPYVAAMQEMLDKKIVGMREDPFGYGAQLHNKEVGQVAPITWTDAIDPQKTGALVSTLKSRVSQAGMVSALEPGVDVPPLTKAEIGTLSHVLHTANADQKTAIAAAMQDGLGEVGVAAVSPRLFKEGVEQRVFGVAAEIAKDRPQVARAIFIGQDVLNGKGPEKVSTMPKPEEVQLMHQQMLYPAFDLFGASDPTEATQQINLPAVYDRYQATSSSVMAYYAYLARGQEKPDQKALMRQAVDAVTGGVLQGPGGYSVFAPRPGMQQGEFDAIWSGLTLDDFGPLAPTTVTGEALSLRDIQDRGILRSVGDGEYEVWMGGSGGNLFQLYRPDNRTPAIVSLRNKAQPGAASITPWLRYGVQN